jgi:hypothetical protein
MNGLDPNIQVIHIGTTTRGKNEFSITLVDIPSNSFIYDSTKESGINSKNLWGIQPLVGRNENANGFFDYTTGFIPDYELREVLSNYGILGNPTEPLLAKALSLITGNTNKAVNYDLKSEFQLNEFDNSKRHSPLKERMILDKNIDLIVE